MIRPEEFTSHTLYILLGADRIPDAGVHQGKQHRVHQSSYQQYDEVPEELDGKKLSCQHGSKSSLCFVPKIARPLSFE